MGYSSEQRLVGHRQRVTVCPARVSTYPHVIRTPLNHIIGFTELVVEGQVGGISPQQKEYLSDALSSAKHLLTLINQVLDIAKLESCLRDHLNKVAHRVMGVLNPLKVVIENYPEGQSEELEAINNSPGYVPGWRPGP